MDAKKIIGVSVVIVLIVVLGFVIVQQMSNQSAEQDPLSMIPQKVQPVRPGLSEEPQVAPLPDTQKPATIDAIVDDIGGESDIVKSAIASEISGESLILEAEGSSLNEVSQFYDENSL